MTSNNALIDVFNSTNKSSQNLVLPLETTPKVVDIVKASWICLLTFAIVFCNILMIAVLNSKHHTRYLRAKAPRYLMTSLACSDLAIGIFVTPFTIYPTLYHSWPFGQHFCAVQALLLPALFHQSTLSLFCVAIDRYICIVHALNYHNIVTRKVCFLMIALTWTTSFGIYAAMIFSKGEYHFDNDGIMSCEPNYSKEQWILIVGASIFYIPPSFTIFYCYIAIFVTAKRQLYIIRKSIRTPSQSQDLELRATGLLINQKDEGTPRLRCDSVQQFHVSEKRMNLRAAVTLALIAMGFFISVTPWTLMEILQSCFNIKVNGELQFACTWIAVSNSFWNVIIYGICNKAFRAIAKTIICQAAASMYRPFIRLTKTSNQSSEQRVCSFNK